MAGYVDEDYYRFSNAAGGYFYTMYNDYVADVVVGTVSTYYKSLERAIAAANSAGTATVKILEYSMLSQSTITLDAGIEITGNITLIMNGNDRAIVPSSTCTTDYLFKVTSTGSLTIKNCNGYGYSYIGSLSSTKTENGGIGVYVNGGTLTISENGAIYGYYGIKVDSGGTVNVNNYTETVQGVNTAIYITNGTANLAGTISGANCGVYLTGSNSTLNVTSGTINSTGDNSAAVEAYSGGVVNVSGGEIAGKYYGIYSDGGIVNVSGGSVSSTSSSTGTAGMMVSGSSQVSITKGTVGATSSKTSDVAIHVGGSSTVTISGTDTFINAYSRGLYAEGGTVTISGALFSVSNGGIDVYADGGTVSISAGGYPRGVTATGLGTISITGGYFNADVNDYVATGYVCESGSYYYSEGGEFTYQVTQSSTPTYVAQIGDTGYTTLAEALSNASSGDTVVLLADNSEEVTISTSITLNLGSYTYSGYMTVSSGDVTINGTVSGRVIVSGGNVTVPEGTSIANVSLNSGSLTVSGGSVTSEIAVNGGTLNVESGTVSGVEVTSGAVNISGGTVTISSVSGGTVNISGGTISGTGFEITGGSVTITNGTITAGIYVGTDGTLSISGGTFSDKENTTPWIRQDTASTYLADGYTAVSNNDGTWTVELANATAINSTTNVKYSTLQNAIDGASSGDTVAPLGALEEDITISSTQSIVLDLAGCTLTGDVTVNGGTLEIKDSVGDGKIDGDVSVQWYYETTITEYSITYYYNGTVISYDTYCEYQKDETMQQYLYFDEVEASASYTTPVRGSLTLTSGTITGSVLVNASDFAMNGGQTGHVAIEYATTEASGYAFINNFTYYSTFNLTGGTITGSTTSTHYLAQAYGGAGVVVGIGCTFNMSGGTITGNNFASPASNTSYGGGVYVYGGGAFTMSGGVITGNSATYGGGVAVNGGTFTMTGGAIYGNTALYAGADIYSNGTSVTLLTASSMTAEGESFSSYAWYNDAEDSRYESGSSSNTTVDVTSAAITGSLAVIASDGVFYIGVVDSDETAVPAEIASGEGEATMYVKVTSDNMSNYSTTEYPTTELTYYYDGSYNNYVFAGWYTSDDGTTFTACDSSMWDDELSGNYYAKFVDANVLTVMTQFTAGTTSGTESTNLRFVSTVDTLDYTKVGFKFTINSKESDKSTTTVYKSIAASTEGDSFSYSPSYFSTSSEYFFTFTITGIPSTAFDTEITVIPYWITADGTTVYGTTKTVKVSDGFSE
ncbi:MAG: hypothetical protein LUE20_08320 [Oscillospiraceae bacterium]|nr:hypothetical protein [Oscillospiraceae bacterium]